jgi:isoquinoline 1-oxidoreductase subunit beta
MKTSRRTFLKTATLGGAALIVGFDSKRVLGANEKIGASDFQPNGWIRIDGRGAVTLTLGKSEMGQGVRTALLMILADELGADWSRIALCRQCRAPISNVSELEAAAACRAAGNRCAKRRPLRAKC